MYDLVELLERVLTEIDSALCNSANPSADPWAALSDARRRIADILWPDPFIGSMPVTLAEHEKFWAEVLEPVALKTS